jgi:photosystem II stability/assembly factor-like uncharacterized protein
MPAELSQEANMSHQWKYLFALIAPVTAFASGRGEISWRSVGPSPPAIEAAIVSNAATHTIYIGSNGGGILKSTDDGASFVGVNNGLDEVTIAAMAMDPKNPEVLYASAADSMYKTVDGGASWFPIGGSGVSLIIDPSNPNTLYAGLSPSGGVLKSVDAGETFLPASNGIGTPAVFTLAIDPNNPNVLYAGTQGLGAFKSSDGAQTWRPLNIDPTVWSLLIDPADSNIVYAGTNGHGIYRSVDAGNSFEHIGSPEAGVVFALAKSGRQLFAGTATQGVSVSDDGGRHWKNTGVTPNTALIMSVGAGGEVYVGTNFDGVFAHRPEHSEDRDHQHARDRGWRRLAWEQLRRCACQNGHAIAVDPGDHDHVLLSTNDGGLLVTEDGGRHWSDGGVNGLITRAPRGIGFDPQAPNHVYVGAFVGSQGVFKSEDHGRHWQLTHFGSSSIYTTGIAVDPKDHSVYVATTQGGQGLWKSTDFGATFARIDRAPGAAGDQYLGLSGRNVTVDPHDHHTVFFAANGAASGVWRSLDAGASWEQVDASDAVLSVTVDPNDSNVVYAGTLSTGVLKSIDGGASFVAKSSGLPDSFQTSRTGSVVIDTHDSNILYVGTEGGGVYRSTDGAESWLPVNTGLGDPNIFGLTSDPESTQGLYASTALSVFKLEKGDRR